MAIIASVLARIKSDPLELLGGAEKVNACFAAVGHRWRDCVLNPANTVALFMLQILNGNTSITHLRLLSRIPCPQASYCDARNKLPVAGVAAVVEQLSCDSARCSDSASRWLGRPVVMTDATTVTTPDTQPLAAIWPQPSSQKPGCGFPMVKMLALMDLATGAILQLTMMCLKVHEMSQLAGPHGALLAGDVLLGDRAFCSFFHLCLLVKQSVDAVFRMHQRQIVDFTPNRPGRGKSKNYKKHKRGIPKSHFVKKLGAMDQIVEWIKPIAQPVWMTAEQFAQMPQTLQIRELCYQITAKGMRTRQVTIATTLLDPMRYPKREIARLYKLRWEIETNFGHMKTTMKMEHLKCKSPDGVIKELMMFALVYNMVRAAMAAAAQQQGLADANRISFIDAQRWLISQIKMPERSAMPELIVNPLRPGRSHPRVKKQRMKKYDLMNKPRSEYTQPIEQEKVGP
jgi:Transposase DDE domain